MHDQIDKKQVMADELTILLSKGNDSDRDVNSNTNKKDFKKCGRLFLFVVVGLVLLLIGLMMKWHVISQSVITPSTAYDIRSEDDTRRYNDDTGTDTEDHDKGATSRQLGKSFSLTVLAQIAWRDLSNSFNFYTNDIFSNGNNNNNNKLCQSNSLIPLYISSNDCNFVIEYFEMNSLFGNVNNNDYDKGCQYLSVDLPLNSNKCSITGEEESNNKYNKMKEITKKMVNYFYDSYSSTLFDHLVTDIEIIKYISNGTGYSGLHSENYHIDGQLKENSNVDYVGIVFLNENFDGGYLEFLSPKCISNVKSELGNGVLFGGGLDYSHRVTPVTNGNRYVVKIIFNKRLK